MKPKVYLETTIVSYLTARPSRDVVMAAMSAQTQKWWDLERDRFELFVSDIVIREASSGDAGAARRRSEVLQRLAAVENDAESQALADVFLHNMALPTKAADDALHIAIAAINQMDYLLTWNCRHIATLRCDPNWKGCAWRKAIVVQSSAHHLN